MVVNPILVDIMFAELYPLAIRFIKPQYIEIGRRFYGG